jgi:2-iminobutanoate/2-iminopropanoate deaminase
MVDAVNPLGVWSPFGAFSMAVLQGDGQIVHLKGQVSLDQSGRVIGPNDMRVQVRRVLENIREVLASMGGQMSDVVSLVHYATDIDQFMSTGDIRKEYFLPHSRSLRPSRSDASTTPT